MNGHCNVCFNELTAARPKRCRCEETHCGNCDDQHIAHSVKEGLPILECFLCRSPRPPVGILTVTSSKFANVALHSTFFSLSHVNHWAKNNTLKPEQGRYVLECTQCPATRRFPMFNNPKSFLVHFREMGH